MQVVRFSMKKLLALAAVAFVLGAVPVWADQGDAKDMTNFQVKTDVLPSCKFTAQNDVNFGSLDVYQFGAKLALGSITVLCTKSGSYSIELDNGVNPNGSGGRQMASGVAAIPYELYQDEQSTKVWKSGQDALGFVGTGLREEKVVYGVLSWTEDMLPNSPVGSYSDLITATVNF